MGKQQRNRFVKKLQHTASDRAIPIDRVGCRDLPDKDGFELLNRSRILKERLNY